MDLRRRTEFQRNLRLEKLIQELNAILEPAELRAITTANDTTYPLILVVGCPRSGTTLLMQWLAHSGQFGYPSNLISRFYAAPYIGARIQQLLFHPDYRFREEFADLRFEVSFESVLGKTSGVLAPNEFFYFWRRFFPYGDIQFLDEESLRTIDVATFVSELAALESVFQKPLAMKGLMINWNIPFVASILERAFFLFVSREPAFNAQSLLQARERFFGDVRRWYSFKPPEYHELKHLEPHEQVAGQVHFTNLGIENGLRNVDGSRWMRISYEDFCAAPETTYRVLRERLTQFGVEIAAPYDGPAYFASTNQIGVSQSRFEAIRSAYGNFAS